MDNQNIIYLPVVSGQKFTAKKNGKTYTKLFVSLGMDVWSLITSDDATALVGNSVPLRLGVRNNCLQLFLAEDELTANG